MQYFPITWPFLLLLFMALIVAIGLLELRLLAYAYERMGLHPRHVFAILLLTLIGSYVNIPVARMGQETVQSDLLITVNGVTYVVPRVEHWGGTVIAVNVGGALIPTILSLYLLAKNRLFITGPLAIAVVATVVYMLARPTPGVGITVPMFIPPLLAAGVAILLAGYRAPPLAYICGSLGTLIGADLMNLGHIQGLGAPVASIGGAGTFDGIFLTGIIAVLIPPTRSMFAQRR